MLLATWLALAEASGDEKGRHLAGTVLDSNKRAVVGAVVHIAQSYAPFVKGPGYPQSGVDYTIRSGPGGRFEVLEDALPPTLQMDLSAGRTVRVWASTDDAVSPATVVSGGTDVDLVLVGALSVRVLVRTARGAASSALVDLRVRDRSRVEEDGRGALYRVVGRTDHAGLLTLEGLPDGDYGEPYVSIALGRTTYTSPHSVARCTLERVASVLVAEVTLPWVRTVRGTVARADGVPASGCLVGYCGVGSACDEYATVLESGAFELPGVPDDAWALVVCTPPESDTQFRFPVAVSVTRLELVDGASASHVGQIRLPTLHDVKVRTVDGEGTPLQANVSISLADARCLSTGWRETDARGTLIWRDAALGAEYEARVSATLPVWGEVEQRVDVIAAKEIPPIEVTGEGYMKIRLFSDEAHRVPVVVRQPRVEWTGNLHSISSGASGGESEFGLWIGSGDSGVVRVTGHGVRGASGPVRLRDKAPTLVDITVYPE
jgi:hypothetical protein